MTAARRYKDVIAAVTQGLDEQAGRDAARVAELRHLAHELDTRLTEASDRHLLTRIGAELAWEDALEVLWIESWMEMRPYPKPDRLVKPGDLAALNLEVEERAAALRAVVQRRRLGLPGR
jgi:hypothetical protein